MTTLASVLRSHISSVLKLTVTDTHCLKQLEIMSKLIWQLYNENMISEEVAHLLLDKHYNRVNNKRF